ncbi:hypothetical protein Actkin_00120 [Actinokineospora sp. UTMC 2448]|nr:hypothetical protein Actkin_00120 [Actinokineospora sp. UTMC 2448]
MKPKPCECRQPLVWMLWSRPAPRPERARPREKA